jgi:hypothetical protein
MLSARMEILFFCRNFFLLISLGERVIGLKAAYHLFHHHSWMITKNNLDVDQIRGCSLARSGSARSAESIRRLDSIQSSF